MDKEALARHVVLIDWSGLHGVRIPYCASSAFGVFDPTDRDRLIGRPNNR